MAAGSSENLAIPLLEDERLLDRAIPPLARRFGIEPSWARDHLKKPNRFLEQMLGNSDDPQIRRQINKWWDRYRSQFPELGLGVLTRVSSPSKLPPSTYKQLICLCWLTTALETERQVRQRRRREVIVKPVPSIWRLIFDWVKRLLQSG